MVELSNLFEYIENNPIILFFIPAAIFGYLFHLAGELVFLIGAGIWATLISLLIGVERSILYPLREPMSDSIWQPPRWYNTEKALALIIYPIYGLYVGPLAILAALNNLLPGNQEISLSEGSYLYWMEIPNEVVESNDLILLTLLGAQIVSYVIIAGPAILSLLLMWTWWIIVILKWLVGGIIRRLIL